MKSFNQFITEAQAVRKFSDTILKNWKKLPFVLRSNIWDRIMPDGTETIAFHITDKTGFENLVKRQGRKNAVSTFNKIYNGGDLWQMLQGIETEGQILLKLKGKSAGEFGFDAYTARTDKGHRTILLKDDEWDDFRYMLSPENQKTFNLLRTHLNTTLMRMVRVKKPEDMDGREKQKFIKDYLDATESFVKQNADAIRAMFSNEMEYNTYNEIVLEYAKIVKAYIMNDSFVNYDWEGTANFAKKNNIPYQLILEDDLINLLKKDPDLRIK